MNRALVLAILLATAGLAGCLGSGDDAPANATSANETQQVANQTPETSEGHTHDATLEAPPEWTPGRFWEVQVTDGQSGQQNTITRVVADEVDGVYRVGMPADDFSHAVVIGHFPGLGNVQPDTLGFAVHNQDFQPLSFPLETGKTWSTTLYQEDFEAEVVETTETTAKVSMQSASGSWINLTYDASMKAVSEYSGPLGLEMSVQSHGHGFEGEVKVPYDRGQFIDGRFVGAFDFMLNPAPPTGTVQVDSSYEEASVALLAGSFNVGATPPGYYLESATDPGDNSTTLETTGELEALYTSSTDVAGEWTFEHVAGGLGAAATEIIAYKTQTVELPTGAE